MGTLLYFPDKHGRATHEGSVVVTAFGMVIGHCTLPWQTVAEVWACRMDSHSAEWTLEFHGAGQRLVIGESHAAFGVLEVAALGVFPSLQAWRAAAARAASGDGRVLLYRRG